MHQYEKLTSWQRSLTLAARMQQRARGVPTYMDRALWGQIVRAAMSVPANIAEGAQRASAREFGRFLSIAIASAAELHTLLLLAERNGLYAAQEAQADAREAVELRRMLVALRGRILFAHPKQSKDRTPEA